MRMKRSREFLDCEDSEESAASTKAPVSPAVGTHGATFDDWPTRKRRKGPEIRQNHGHRNEHNVARDNSRVQYGNTYNYAYRAEQQEEDEYTSASNKMKVPPNECTPSDDKERA